MMRVAYFSTPLTAFRCLTGQHCRESELANLGGVIPVPTLLDKNKQQNENSTKPEVDRLYDCILP